MDLKKAEDIYKSLGVINVSYKNRNIWIEDIQKETSTAHIKDLKTDELEEVPIAEFEHL
jgi:H-type small acid-soluble spore protein